MDGVIVDNHQWHLDAFIEFGKRHGLHITRENFSKYFGSTNSLIMNSLFGGKLTKAEIESLSNEKEEIYREMYRSSIQPVAGLQSFLSKIEELGIKIALATSASKENVTFTLQATGLESYFQIITDASSVTHGKPDPQVYLVTAQKLGVQPYECIVFEDSIAGIASAKSAGMQVIGVATTYKSQELLMYVNEIIMNFEAPEKLIERLQQITKSQKNI
jgi:beta-phosphoglucomutase